MSKRSKFLLTSLFLSFGFVLIQVIPYRISSIFVLSFVTLILFFWSLKEGLGKDMTLSTLILPFFYTLSVGFFWFLLPSNILARIPIILVYGLGIYSLCLTMNIYTVSAIRTIALLRAARGVGFFLTLFTLFFLYDTIFSLRLPVYFMSFLVGLVSFPVYFQGYWVMDLKKDFSSKVFKVTLVATLVVFEFSTVLFFWPVSAVVGSLFLTSLSYVLLGLGQAELEGRLFRQTVREYLLIGVTTALIIFLKTSWG